MITSVVIPFHNEGELLRRAVESALDADEIIIAGDAPNHETVEIASQLVWRYGISYIVPPRPFASGVCVTRNAAITHAKDDALIIPLDADDMFLRGGIDALVSHWQPDRWVYPCYQEWSLETGHIRDVTAPPPAMLSRKNIAQATMCFSKKQWLIAGGYDVDFTFCAEDFAFQCALTQAGFTPYRVDILSYAYTIKDNGRAARCLRYSDCIKRLLKEKYPTVFEK